MVEQKIRPPQIVIIDDSEAITAIMEESLHFELGYDVEVAHNGLDGLSLVRRVVPDLVMLDYSLPRYNGEMFMQEFLRDHHINQIPVWLISAMMPEQLRITAHRIGCTDYLKKPFDLEVLEARVQAALPYNRVIPAR